MFNKRSKREAPVDNFDVLSLDFSGYDISLPRTGVNPFWIREGFAIRRLLAKLSKELKNNPIRIDLEDKRIIVRTNSGYPEKALSSARSTIANLKIDGMKTNDRNISLVELVLSDGGVYFDVIICYDKYD